MRANRDGLRDAPVWIDLAAKVTRRLPAGRGRVIDWFWRDSRRTFLARTAPQLGGDLFECSPRDIVARSLFFAGSYAQHEAAIMRAVLRDGMTFVDVGAHWGLLSMAASHLVGPAGRVVALEPDPRLRAQLQSNIEMNAIGNIAVYGDAAIDREAELTLSGYDREPDRWSASRLVEGSSPGPSTFVVRGARLDDILNRTDVGDVDLVKIDVEGVEDLVLSGMRQGLERRRYRRVLLELHPAELASRSKSVPDVSAMLIASGYRGYWLDASHQSRRRAYYDPWRPPVHLLQPFGNDQDWASHGTPHTVWMSPDVPASELESG